MPESRFLQQCSNESPQQYAIRMQRLREQERLEHEDHWNAHLRVITNNWTISPGTFPAYETRQEQRERRASQQAEAMRNATDCEYSRRHAAAQREAEDRLNNPIAYHDSHLYAGLSPADIVAAIEIRMRNGALGRTQPDLVACSANEYRRREQELSTMLPPRPSQFPPLRPPVTTTPEEYEVQYQNGRHLYLYSRSEFISLLEDESYGLTRRAEYRLRTQSGTATWHRINRGTLDDIRGLPSGGAGACNPHVQNRLARETMDGFSFAEAGQTVSAPISYAANNPKSCAKDWFKKLDAMKNS